MNNLRISLVHGATRWHDPAGNRDDYGKSVSSLRDQAARLDAAVCGSVQLRVSDVVFNRLLWATPDGNLRHYDKRHLFRFDVERPGQPASRPASAAMRKWW